MRVYFAVKFREDMSNRTDVESVLSVLEKAGCETVCFVRDVEKWGQSCFEAHELMSMAFKEIDTSDAVIIDLTEKGVGLGIEAGYAYARNKQIITIARAGSDISTTLRGISKHVLQYKNIGDLAQQISTIMGKCEG